MNVEFWNELLEFLLLFFLIELKQKSWTFNKLIFQIYKWIVNDDLVLFHMAQLLTNNIITCIWHAVLITVVLTLCLSLYRSRSSCELLILSCIFGQVLNYIFLLNWLIFSWYDLRILSKLKLFRSIIFENLFFSLTFLKIWEARGPAIWFDLSFEYFIRFFSSDSLHENLHGLKMEIVWIKL